MAHAKHLEEFPSAVCDVHSTSGGTKETSCYTAINNLMDGVGQALKPKVRMRHAAQEPRCRQPRRGPVHG